MQNGEIWSVPWHAWLRGLAQRIDAETARAVSGAVRSGSWMSRARIPPRLVHEQGAHFAALMHSRRRRLGR